MSPRTQGQPCSEPQERLGPRTGKPSGNQTVLEDRLRAAEDAKSRPSSGSTLSEQESSERLGAVPQVLLLRRSCDWAPSVLVKSPFPGRFICKCTCLYIVICCVSDFVGSVKIY